jgi:hypothetical protein
LFTDRERGGRSGRPPSTSAYVDAAWLGPTKVVPGSYARGHRQDQEDGACNFNGEVEYDGRRPSTGQGCQQRCGYSQQWTMAQPERRVLPTLGTLSIMDGAPTTAARDPALRSDVRADIESWFVRRGVPQLIADYATERSMDARGRPFVVIWLVFGSFLWWGARPDASIWMTRAVCVLDDGLHLLAPRFGGCRCGVLNGSV